MDNNQQGQQMTSQQLEQNNFQESNPIQNQNQFQNYPNHQPPVPGAEPASSKKSSKAIIFIIIAIVAVIIVGLVVFFTISNDEVIGDWKCQHIDSDQPSVRIQLNKDGTFMYGSYQDFANNHFSGTYEAEYDADKTTEVTLTGVGNANWYNFKFTTTEFIRDGIQQSLDGHGLTDAVMAIEAYGNGKKATTLFGHSYYFCFAE